MMKIKKPLILGLVAGIALSTAAITPAFADPVSNGLVAVGSDTLQDSMNALTNGTSVTGSTVRIVASSGTPVGNFDAFGSSPIQTKSTGAFFARPNGSGAGVDALISSITGQPYGSMTTAISGQVDIARSSSGPGANADASGRLAYVPYARDAVAYIYYPDPAAPNDLAHLTAADLKTIYSSDTVQTFGTTAVHPLIPQPASGTRKFFLTAIGMASSPACGLSTCPTTGANVSTIPENDASQLTQVGQIIPFSVASWIAQSNKVAPSTIGATSTVKLGSPTGTAPTTGSGTSLSANSAYYANTTWGRDTYLVVEFDRLATDPDLAGLVDDTTTSLTNFSSALPSQPGSVKIKFGFIAPSSTTVKRAKWA